MWFKSRDITVVGVPITQESATKEFYTFFDQKITCVVASASYPDYYGYRYIKERGHKIITLNAWVENNKRIDGFSVAKKVIDVIKSLPRDSKYAYLAPGSPYYFDSVCKKLTKRYPVIDTKSSGELCYEALGIAKPMNIVEIVDVDNFELKSDAVNVLACVGRGYSQFYNQTQLLEKLSEDMIAYSVEIGYTNKIEQIDILRLRQIIESGSDYFNYKTLCLLA